MLKKRPFEFPGEKAIRVICDTDAYNECDDQFCVAHLPPKLFLIIEAVKGVSPVEI